MLSQLCFDCFARSVLLVGPASSVSCSEEHSCWPVIGPNHSNVKTFCALAVQKTNTVLIVVVVYLPYRAFVHVSYSDTLYVSQACGSDIASDIHQISDASCFQLTL
jgi:hypothetical protein